MRSETVHKVASGTNGSGWTRSKKNGGEIPARRRQWGEICGAEVDKSEEGPGVSSQTETCLFGPRVPFTTVRSIPLRASVTTGNLET